MYKIYVACDISGDNFSPQRFNLGFSTSIEPGEIRKTGRYKNQPSPYGRAVLSFDWRPGEPAEKGRNIHKAFIDKVKLNLQAFRDAGATDIHLDIAIEYDVQCNLAFDPRELREISELNIPVLVSVYKAGIEA